MENRDKEVVLDKATNVVTYVATFENHYKAMLFKKGMGEGCVLKPVPRLLSSSCGTAAFFSLSSNEEKWIEEKRAEYAKTNIQLVEAIYRLEGKEGDRNEHFVEVYRETN